MTRRTTIAHPASADRRIADKNPFTEITTVERDTPNADGTPGAPAGIETRNAGVMLEVEPVI